MNRKMTILHCFCCGNCHFKFGIPILGVPEEKSDMDGGGGEGLCA